MRWMPILLLACLFGSSSTMAGMPANIQAADRELNARLDRVIRMYMKDFVNSSELGWSNFGTMPLDGSKRSFRRIAAGLEAMRRFPAGDPLRPPADFPQRVATWIENNVYSTGVAGTGHNGSGGDFDFDLVQIAQLVWRFKDREDLLSTNAAWRILMPNTGGINGIMYTGPNPDKMIFSTYTPIGPIHYPETENHVLMTQTWRYLINQWIRMNPRNDSRIAGIYNTAPSQYVNDGTAVEDILLSALGRIVQNGYFETNSRAYQALSVNAIMALYTYADQGTAGGRRMRTAAKNALDYTAAMFAFQSFHGKRYGYSRRNLKDYGQEYGLYSGDYLPFIMGMLSGVYSYDDNPDCQGNCPGMGTQPKGFALWAGLSEYRIPTPIHQFMISKDGGSPGYGYWARMQARFTDRHYIQGAWSRYAVVPGGSNAHGDPNLSQENKRKVPEFYFANEDFVNIAGGRPDPYSRLSYCDDAPNDNDEPCYIYDAFTRPSSVIPRGNHDWTDLAGGMGQVMMVGANTYAHNSVQLGVYKNVTFGPANSLPPSFGSHVFAGMIALRGTYSIYEPSAASGLGNYYLVRVGAYNAGTNKQVHELVPKSKFASAAALKDHVLAHNPSSNFIATSPYICASGGSASFNYRTATTGETLTLSLCDASGPDVNPIRSINGDATLTRNVYMQLTSQTDMDAFPLLEVTQVDANYGLTGVKYAYSSGDGYIEITHPIKGKVIIDSRNYLNPSNQAPPKPKFAHNAVLALLLD